MRYGMIGFVLGLVLGVSGMILVPRFAGSYLPETLRSAVSVEGRVVAKQREPDRLLLTVRTEDGSTLVTFTERVPEIDLLVQESDTIVLSMKQYRPFVENPEIMRVGKEQGGHVPAGAAPMESIGPLEEGSGGT